MRVGVNPEKLDVQELTHKPHRVIIPVYIPNLEEEYFKNALEVLKICLDSLLATANLEQTNITVINNNSCIEVDKVLKDYFQKDSIDKYVQLNENRGKVEPVLSEAMASYEEFITISDADVLFKEGWLEESMKIFKTFQAGVVMPLPTPNNYATNNVNCLMKFYLTRQLKKGSVVKKEDLIDFEKSIGTTTLMEKYYDEQFYVQKNDTFACLGAGHFVATYDRQLFKFSDISKKVKYVFKNGQERDYLDNLTTVTGTCRLGTLKPYVYHMGNTVPEKCHLETIEKPGINFSAMPERSRQSSYMLLLNRILFKLFKLLHNVK